MPCSNVDAGTSHLIRYRNLDLEQTVSSIFVPPTCPPRTPPNPDNSLSTLRSSCTHSRMQAQPPHDLTVGRTENVLNPQPPTQPRQRSRKTCSDLPRQVTDPALYPVRAAPTVQSHRRRHASVVGPSGSAPSTPFLLWSGDGHGQLSTPLTGQHRLCSDLLSDWLESSRVRQGCRVRPALRSAKGELRKASCC